MTALAQLPARRRARHRRRGTHARGPRHAIRTMSTSARRGRSGPGCRSCSPSGPPGADADQRGGARHPRAPARVARLGTRRTSTCSPTRPAATTGVDRRVCRDYLGDLDYALSYRHLAGLTDFFRRLAQDGLVPDGCLASSRQRRRHDHHRSHRSRVPADRRALPEGAAARARPTGRRRAVAPPPRSGRHLHHRPEHQLHQRLRRRLRLLRLLPAPQAQRGLRPEFRADRRARSTSARRWAGCRSCCRAGTTRTSRSSGTSS